MIGLALRQLIGLFVEDGFLALAILMIVAAAVLLAGVAPAWVAGLVLALALPAALAASVAIGVRAAGRGSAAD
jgi:hypothetical protein